MQAVTENISRIQAKLQELLRKYQVVVKEAEQQKKALISLQEQYALAEKKIKTLEEQQHILKSASGTLNGNEKKEFDQVIGKYIKEIDKCIGLLSE